MIRDAFLHPLLFPPPAIDRSQLWAWLINDIYTQKNQLQFTVALKRYTFLLAQFSPRHDCPFAVFMFWMQPNDCWGFGNCINTKIIGSNIHICIHTCFKWGKTAWKNVNSHANPSFVLQLRFHCYSTRMICNQWEICLIFYVNLLLPQKMNCLEVNFC